MVLPQLFLKKREPILVQTMRFAPVVEGPGIMALGQRRQLAWLLPQLKKADAQKE